MDGNDNEWAAAFHGVRNFKNIPKVAKEGIRIGQN